jgi:two-component system, cell cycle response regulator DivK
MEENPLRTVLVVDDNEEQRRIVATYLEFVGYRALTAANGEQGVRMALADAPDLILLDLRMPVLDGWGTIARLKESALTGRIPVMALTAYGQDEEEALEAAGFCGCLSKPLSPFKVLEGVERCLAVGEEEGRPGSWTHVSTNRRG